MRGAKSRSAVPIGSVKAWYDRIGQPYRVERFGWIGWLRIFTTDPEGNTVERVAYDASLKDPA